MVGSLFLCNQGKSKRIRSFPDLVLHWTVKDGAIGQRGLDGNTAEDNFHFLGPFSSSGFTGDCFRLAAAIMFTI